MRTIRILGAALGAVALLATTTVQAAAIRPGDSLVSARAATNTPIAVKHQRQGAAMEDGSNLTQTVIIAIIVGGIIVGYAFYELVIDEESP